MIIPIKNEGHLYGLYNYFCENSLRNRIIYEIAIDTGIPISVIVGWTIGDLDKIDIHGDYKEEIRILLSQYPYEYNSNDFIFTTRRGKNPLTVQEFSRILQIASQHLNFDVSYTSESLRKTYYYKKYIEGEALKDIQEELNHSRPYRTKEYLCLDIEDEIKHLTAIKEKETIDTLYQRELKEKLDREILGLDVEKINSDENKKRKDDDY